jgi:hypothetical protein
MFIHRVAIPDFWRAFHYDGWKNPPWLVRVGGSRPRPFTPVTITNKVAVYAPAERADTLPLFHLYSYKYYSVGLSLTLTLATFHTKYVSQHQEAKSKNEQNLLKS